jgi:hypothetical protein
MSVFLKIDQQRYPVVGGRCLSVSGPDPPPFYTLYEYMYLFTQGTGGGGGGVMNQ